MANLFSVLLIIFGSFLEIWFYYWRFANDGIQWWLSFIIGSALTLMLSLAVYERKNRWMIFLVAPLIAYSILATSAGQTFSLNSVIIKNKTAIFQQDNINKNIDEIEQRIQSLNNQISELQNQRSATLTSLEDRFEWKNTTAGSEEREDQLKAERKEYETRLNLLRDSQTNIAVLSEKSQTIYEFYNSLVPIKTTWIQFIFQTLLSGFIAFMAPLGIITYKRKIQQPVIHAAPIPVSAPVHLPVVQVLSSPSDRFIRRWLQINWLGVEKEKSDSILPIETFKTFMENRNEAYEKSDYDYVLNRSIERKIIDKNHKIIEKNRQKAYELIK